MSDWEQELNDLIMRAHREEAEAQENLRFIERLAQFNALGRELKAAFLAAIRHDELRPHEAAAIAGRFAPEAVPPPLPPRQTHPAMQDVVDQSYGKPHRNGWAQ